MENTHTERESMVFYKSFFEAIQDLPGEEFKKCATAILNYGLKGILPETSGFEKAIITLVKPQIDKNNQRWANAKKSHCNSGHKQAELCEANFDATQKAECVGEYKNVCLKQEEISELVRVYGEKNYKEAVQFLSKYIKRKPGYRSACHYEDLRGWVQDALSKQNERASSKKEKTTLDFDFDFEDIYEQP